MELKDKHCVNRLLFSGIQGTKGGLFTKGSYKIEKK